MRARQIKNVDRPNLFREIFVEGEVPRILFNQDVVPRNMANNIWITDTTFRDGQQAREPYRVGQILQIYNLLNKLDNNAGVIRQSEFFLYSKEDKEAVQACLGTGHQFPEVTGWIRALPEDFKLVKGAGLKETGILTSCSDYHIFIKLKKDRKKAAEQYLEVVEAALSEGIRPRCHLEDITRADFDGFVIPFVQKLMRLSEEVDENLKIKIRACDTLGLGVSDPYVKLPRGVPKLIYTLINEAGVPSERLEWHGHNDLHKVASNAMVAWMYGASAVNCTLLGIGERTGNPPLEGAVLDYVSLRENPGLDTKVINEIANYYRGIGVEIPTNYPIIGRDAFTTRAGIHADGLTKDEEIYNPFDPEIVDREAEVAITNKTGFAGIKYWVESHYNVQLPKHDQRVENIHNWISEQYMNKRITAISSGEMHGLVAQYVPGAKPREGIILKMSG